MERGADDQTFHDDIEGYAGRLSYRPGETVTLHVSTRRERFDVVVTVCDHAHETCPIFPGNARVVHRAFDDPPKLAAGAIDTEEALGHYRRVRDEIKAYVLDLPQALGSASGTSD